VQKCEEQSCKIIAKCAARETELKIMKKICKGNSYTASVEYRFEFFYFNIFNFLRLKSFSKVGDKFCEEFFVQKIVQPL
jgi:hypothetical protein